MLIREFLDFNKYVNKNEKIDNMKKARQLEQLCNKQKENFDTIVNKIQKQDQAFIYSARNSFRISLKNTQKDNQDGEMGSQVEEMFRNGEEFLESHIGERQKQIDLINQ